MIVDCPVVREKLNAYLDDELEGSQRERVREHIGNCPDCSLYYEELKQLNEDLQSALVSDAEPSDAFTQDLLDRAGRMFPEAETNTTDWNSFSNHTGSVLAAVTLMIGLFIGTYTGIGFLDHVFRNSANKVATQTGESDVSIVTDTFVNSPERSITPPDSVEEVSFREPYYEVSEVELSDNP